MVFCAQKCLHLWQAPKKVITWLNDPTDIELALEVVTELKTSRPAQNPTTWKSSVYAAHAAEYAAYYMDIAANAENTALALGWVAYEASYSAAEALKTSIDKLKQEFLSTLNYEDLSTTDSEWLKYATVEIFNREAAMSFTQGN